jgi:leucyl aminopeptidase
MTPFDCLVDKPEDDVVPLSAVTVDTYDAWLDAQEETVRNWLARTGFRAAPGHCSTFPASEPSGTAAVVVIGSETPLWDWASPSVRLPAQVYQLCNDAPAGADTAALGWALGAYRFRSYRDDDKATASLVWPNGSNKPATKSIVEATYLARDLINMPANDLGPAELAGWARLVSSDYDATCTVISGDSLLLSNYPAIHRVGMGSQREPHLIDLRWGIADGPKVTIVGKGVCFDSGGLDLKPASAMRLMKKDMGGGAVALGLAKMIMAADLPIRLRLLIPAVENSVSGSAMRPMDVIRTRSGLTVEVGNTDAEGRLILADALFEASSEHPDLVIDCATLTGAARIAVGTEIPAMFSNDDALAADLLECGQRACDPLWRLPLWKPYRRFIDGRTADLTNDSASPYAGAVTAALFLSEFLEPQISWVHLDLMGWNLDSRPGRPEGGEVMGMRALFELIQSRYAA